MVFHGRERNLVIVMVSMNSQQTNAMLAPSLLSPMMLNNIPPMHRQLRHSNTMPIVVMVVYGYMLVTKNEVVDHLVKAFRERGLMD